MAHRLGISLQGYAMWLYNGRIPEKRRSACVKLLETDPLGFVGNTIPAEAIFPFVLSMVKHLSMEQRIVLGRAVRATILQESRDERKR